MRYKSMVLELIQLRPEMEAQLRQEHKLLESVNHYAGLLKSIHETWKDWLVQAKPESDPSQIASEALEIALQELEGSLPPASPPSDELYSLDAAMAYLDHTRPA